MLAENNDIDQLFRRKLGEFEKTPPANVWAGIEGRLDKRVKGFRMLRRSVGAAAVLAVALFAGLQINNHADQGIPSKTNIVLQKDIKNDATSPTNSSKIQGVNEKVFSKANQPGISKISSLATFAPNGLITKTSPSAKGYKDEPVIPESEIRILEKLEQNFEAVKKMADWIADKVSPDSLPSNSNISKSESFVFKTPLREEKPQSLQPFNDPPKNTNRWSLKAELAPVFNTQTPNGGQVGLSNSSLNSSRQNTSAENTFSAGVVAGYKLSKHLTVKSGVVFNTIKQSTRNIDFIGVAPFFNDPGKAISANTPSGQVMMHRSDRTIFVSDVNSTNNPDQSQIYSGETVLKQNFDFIEVPLIASYNLINSKLNIGLNAGLNAGVLIGNKAILSGSGTRISTGETSNLRNMVYSGAVGIEFGYEISNRITFTVEPRLKYYLNSLNANNSVNFKPNQLEISTGLTYSFN